MKIPVYCAQYGTFIAMADVDNQSAERIRERSYWANKVNVPVPAMVTLDGNESACDVMPRHAEVGIVKMPLPSGHLIYVGLTLDRELLKEPRQ